MVAFCSFFLKIAFCLTVVELLSPLHLCLPLTPGLLCPGQAGRCTALPPQKVLEVLIWGFGKLCTGPAQPALRWGHWCPAGWGGKGRSVKTALEEEQAQGRRSPHTCVHGRFSILSAHPGWHFQTETLRRSRDTGKSFNARLPEPFGSPSSGQPPRQPQGWCCPLWAYNTRVPVALSRSCWQHCAAQRPGLDHFVSL